ncbi:MAG TPA: nucleotide disphospho-sugar-binding domain-containing protein, partial [Rugosimonospora sp.]|nr:nucleotide disphospho-sugar-binding domain-containing protein [Rugosimonospora sp.]
MRVLFTSVDWTGHLFPMVPLGWALRAAGHDVRVLCSAGLAPAASRAGLTPLPLLETTGVVQARMNNHLRALAGHGRTDGLPPVHPLTGAEMDRLEDFDLAGLTGGEQARERWVRRRRDILRGLVDQWRPDLVVHDLSSVDGRAVAELADVPAVAHLWGLVADAEPEDEMDYRPEAIDTAFDLFRLTGRGATISHVLDPTPDSLAPPVKAQRLPMRYVPYNGTGAAPVWTLEPRTRPRVCVVWGTSVTKVYGPRSFLVPRVVEALGGLDLDVVLAVDGGDLSGVGALPANTALLRERAPLHALLSGCDAVVHNGAAGSAMTALAAGVPQLALSISDEQAGNGIRVAAGGSGLHLAGPPSEPAAI